MKTISLLLLLASWSSSAFAWNRAGNWFHIDYTYSQITYQEPTVMKETGNFAGVRGELGLNLLGWGAISAGGSYMDGHMNYDGSTFDGTAIKTITKDYFRDTRILVHAMSFPFTLSFGVAQRYWYDDLVISYRRRTRYDYNPIILTYTDPTFYLRYEQDLWSKGWNKSHMSDVSNSRRDVEFELGKGTGMGIELGLFAPTQGYISHLFVAYHKWTVKQSNVQNDGTSNLVEPDNQTETLQLGLGIVF